MTLQVLLWALGTGFVTGAVWFGIIFFRRHPSRARELPRPPESLPGESITPEHMARRLLELEERLDATEQLLKREKIKEPRNER
jgi:hypothetical protein